jgi:hypothetical protein
VATVTLELARFETMADEVAERGLIKAAAQGAALLKADILSRPGRGRKYGRHTASAPGDPPAPDTGQLRNSVDSDTTVRRDANGDLVGRIVENSDKALALELGTERMAARPHFRRLVSEHQASLQAAFVSGAQGR